VLLTRTAAKEAAFFLPCLRPGLRVLDLGCGHGTITVGLAEAVAPGQVIGIDLDPARIAAATKLGVERDVRNVEFRVGDLTGLPFPDESFDAVFEHAVFMYLPDPLQAAREVRRMLRPGGVFGMRDTDFRATVSGNSSPLKEQAWQLVHAWYAQRGTDLELGRRLRQVLHDAGFVRILASATCDSYGTPDALRTFSEMMVRNLRQPDLIAFAATTGWGDAAKLDHVCAAVETWGTDPHSFHAGVMGEAIGWKE
jgi:ubiquinone/menaquinone biosynthesis C-methylase UbiE